MLRRKPPCGALLATLVVVACGSQTASDPGSSSASPSAVIAPAPAVGAVSAGPAVTPGPRMQLEIRTKDPATGKDTVIRDGAAVVSLQDVGVTEPGVAWRHRLSSGEVATDFRPATSRPSSYPAGLPFIAGAEVVAHVTPGGAQLPGAVWHASSIQGRDRLVGELASQLQRDGWISVVSPPLPNKPASISVRAFKKGDAVRLILSSEDVVQLTNASA